MKPNADVIKSHTPILVATYKFLKLWNDYPKNDDHPFYTHTRYADTPSIWNHDRKLKKGETSMCFSYGICNPVKAPIIQYIQDNKIYLQDGITRILYLLINKAEAFPIMCPNIDADHLEKICGIL